MKILFAGGGTGGHFYPIIAVNRALHAVAEKRRLVDIKTMLLSTSSYDKNLLQQENIDFRWVPAGKMRRYFSLYNIFDAPKTGFGVAKALFHIFTTIPDVIFAKGGHASFPALLAGRIFRIPVIIHESDVVPGRVNAWAASFAKRIAISFPESARYFPQSKTALTGHPVRKSVLGGNAEEARVTFALEKGLPTLVFLGGSQGAQKLNDTLLSILPSFLEEAQIIHQTGSLHVKEVTKRADIILERHTFKNRYHPFAFLNEAQLRDVSQVADVVVSRAGAGSIFMIAAWGLPSILIPLPNAAQDHQRENAYAYAHAGSSSVIEENNLSPHLLREEVNRILTDEILQKRMRAAASNFARKDAAEKIANEIIDLALEHIT